MTRKLYAQLETQAVDGAEQRTIMGIASTPETDRQGDIVEPLGLTFRNPVSLLWLHDHKMPVGTVMFDPPTPKGITFTARLPKVQGQSSFADTVESAWEAVRSGAVRGVSIGFRPIKAEPLGSGGVRFLAAELLELSLVPVPANAGSGITAIKRYAQSAGLGASISPSGVVCRAATVGLDNALSAGASDRIGQLTATVGAGLIAVDDELDAMRQRLAALEDEKKSVRLTDADRAVMAAVKALREGY